MHSCKGSKFRGVGGGPRGAPEAGAIRQRDLAGVVLRDLPDERQQYPGSDEGVAVPRIVGGAILIAGILLLVVPSRRRV